MKHLALTFAVLTLTFSTHFACTKKQSARDKDKLVINLETEPPSLDWNQSADTTSAEVTDNLMDGLVDYDIKSSEMKIVPKIAETWDISKDGLIYTFHLRKDVKWHDGVPVIAQQFVDGWERLLNPATAAPYAYFLYDVKNAKAYNSKQVDFSQVGVKALDANTLQVILERPATYFINIPTHHSSFPIRKELISKYGDSWTEAGKFVGNGPYQLKEWIHDSQMTLERFESYWGPKPPIKIVNCRMVTELSSALTLYETGQIDVIFPKLPSLELPRLRKQYPDQLKEDNQLGSFYIGINIRKKPFDDPRVRKAVSMAIDRTEITKIKNGGEIPFSSWIPKGMMGYNPNQGVKFNPEEAKKLLKAAGFENGDKFPVVKLMYNTNEDHKPVMENIQAQLARNLGIKVSIENQEWKTYLDKLQNLKKLKNHETSSDAINFFRMGWIGDYPDPDNFMVQFTSYSDNNHTGWKNPKYDKLVLEAQGERDQEKRKKLYSEMQQILVEEDIPIMPLFVYSQQLLIKPYVKGYTQNPLQKLYLDQFYIE